MNQNIINTINNLNTNPLYYMSLSSMELFHSNFWSWLMKTDYRYIGAFFDELKKIHTNDTVEITREDRHTDILIKVNDECYLIENKIKTLVDKEQLIKYETDFKKNKLNFKKGKYLFPLKLDELQDIFKDDKVKHNWTFIDYRTLLKDIDSITDIIINESHTDNFNYQIIKKYIEMTNDLINIIEYSVNEYYKNKFIVSDERDIYLKNLEKLRIYDIIGKINRDFLKNKLVDKLKQETAFINLYEKIYIETGFSRGHAYLSARWKIYYDENNKKLGYMLIGPQLQDYQFKTMIHICSKYFGIENIKSKNKQKQREILDNIYDAIEKEIFERGEKYYKSKFKKEYNEYKGTINNFEYIALYKYKRINNYKNNKDLSNFDDLCEEFINVLKIYQDIDKDKIINLIKEGLSKIKI